MQKNAEKSPKDNAGVAGVAVVVLVANARIWLLIAGLFLVLTGELRAAPDAGGVTLEMPEGDKIAPDTSLSLSFPDAMAGTDKIDLAGEACPLKMTPAVPGEWLWKSQTDGQFTVKGPVLPGQDYVVALAAGLRNLAGAAVAPAGWSATLHTAPFEASSDWEQTDHLAAKPAVVVKFTYPVRLSDAAGRIYFQDRDKPADRQPAEIALREQDRDDEPEAAVLCAIPREPLPPGRTWDLVVEDVREHASGAPTPYLKRIPLGQTAPLTLKWLGAFNLPLEKPLVRARFDDYLDPASITGESVRVEPPVPNCKARADDEDVVIEGDFDRAKHYVVTVQPTVRGRRGFGPAGAERRGATFRAKASALFFPGARVNQRSRLGLRFAFMQVHTGPLRWRLASVPPEKFALVQSRVREFTDAKLNPVSHEPEVDADGVEVPQPTELLIDTLGLATKGEGTFPASAGEAEDLREVRWTPPGGGAVPPGIYLLEMDGPRPDGKGTVGHRSVVFFSESVLTEKRTPDTVVARLAGMADGKPQPGVTIRAVSESNFEVARAVTDRDGVARFVAANLKPPKGERGGEAAKTLVADTPEGPAVSTLDGAELEDVYIPEPTDEPKPATVVRGVVLTDRSLYRPGHTVHVKGLVRFADAKGGDGALRVPAGRTVRWTITPESGNEPAAGGETTLDAEGGWEAEWAIATGARLGGYQVTCVLVSQDAADGPRGTGVASTSVQVQDYKVPLYEVAAENAPAAAKALQAACHVRATYFAGQPVAGAKVAWRVHWQPRDYLRHSDDEEEGAANADRPPSFELTDYQSEKAKEHPEEGPPAETKGEGRLGPGGEANLAADLPPNLPAGRYDAEWEIAVTSADGQNVAVTRPPTSTVMRQTALLGIGADQVSDGTLYVRVAAFDAADKLAHVNNVKVEVFRVGNKVVRENVAPFVTRYRNTARYAPVKTGIVATAGLNEPVLDLPIKEPGRYVAVASAPGLHPVSTEIFADGPGEDEVPVRSETSLELRAEKKDYALGERATFITRTPVTGVAWVSVETDEIVDGLLLPLPGNTTRVEIPIKPEYAPNARVAVYLLRPGGGDRLPAERFASAELRVRRPDRVLDVQPALDAARVLPGGEVRATVRVGSAGRPVVGADVTVWAVDDAILALGEWHAPELAKTFYPDRPHRVKTYAALREFVTDIPRKSLFEKGFIIGGGGEEFGAKFVRKDFQPLAYWKTGLKTDRDGRVTVAFAAPDNLTRYRLVAVAQTRAGQFGEGEGSVEVAKPLIVEPSLPRFLRAGDTVELRAVVRQSERDEASLVAACTTDGGVKLETEDSKATAPTKRDAPAIFRFRAKVPDDGRTSAKISFSAGIAAGDAGLSDAVEVTLPILPPTVLRRESVIGSVSPGGDVDALMPKDARGPGAGGRYDVAVATSPDLPRLRALPEVLEYPHGCFEQITSRVLAYCGVHELFAGLPSDQGADAHYRQIVEHALEQCARAVLPNDQLPYWSSRSEANPFVTIQAVWAGELAMRAGFKVEADAFGKLAGAVEKYAANESLAPELRAFALFAQASAMDQGNGGLNADAARAVFLRRETLGDDGRALLAVALHRAKIMPDEQRQLLREILPLANGSKAVPARAFDPDTFGSSSRAAAMAAWACAEVRPPEWKAADAVAVRARLGKTLDQAAFNSTQENLWTLLAFQAVRKAENLPKLRAPTKTRPAPTLVSPDGTAAEWSGLTLGGGSAVFRLPLDLGPGAGGSAGAALACVLTAEYRVGKAEEDTRLDRGGMRLERVVRNLTDAKRTGRPGELAVRVNDRLLVTYRMQTPKPRSYIALEDELPAGLEAINPDLPMFAAFYDLPPTPPGEHAAELSASELRDHVTRAYFDRVAPGVSTSSVLVRATTAGTFRWPATQAGPMYEPAVGALAPSGELVVEGEP